MRTVATVADVVMEHKSVLFIKVVSLGLIARSSLWLAIIVDMDTAEVPTGAHPIFQMVADFCCFYIVMLLTRVGAYQSKTVAMQDAELLFNSLLVVSLQEARDWRRRRLLAKLPLATFSSLFACFGS